MDFLKRIFFPSLGSYIGASVVAVLAGVFRYSTLPDDVGLRFAWFEILSVSGMITVLIGALLMVSHFGAFDLFGYVFSPGRRGAHRKYKGYADYSLQKTEKRAKEGYFYVPYFVVGIVLLLISAFFA